MGKDSAITWTHHTWSPWLGCRKVSEGCDNCYITSTTPFRTRGLKHGGQREGLSEAYWKQPERWNREAQKNGMRYRVFPSLCDPFDEEVPIHLRLAFFDTIKITPHLDWLLLTKRPQAALRFYENNIWKHSDGRVMPVELRSPFTLDFIPNVWLGVSCENQRRADERIPILLSIPAKVRFVSVEPMLGPIQLTTVCGLSFNRNADHSIRSDGGKLDWVIFGGESGPNRRDNPDLPNWIGSGVAQCKAAGVAAFVKQDCSAKPGQQGRISKELFNTKEFPKA